MTIKLRHDLFSQPKKPTQVILTYLFTCEVIPHASVRASQGTSAPCCTLFASGWFARAFSIRRDATGLFSALCRPSGTSHILQFFSLHQVIEAKKVVQWNRFSNGNLYLLYLSAFHPAPPQSMQRATEIGDECENWGGGTGKAHLLQLPRRDLIWLSPS